MPQCQPVDSGIVNHQVAAQPNPASAPDRATASIGELFAYAREMGIAAVDLPAVDPDDWRRLPLKGGYNFRDVGGYVGHNGQTVKRGHVWRSDHLNELTDDDLTTLDTLDLQVIHDFRIDLEVDRQPSRRSTVKPARVVRLVLGDVSGSEAAIEIIADIMAGRRPAPAPDFWNDNYLDMLGRGRHMFVGLFSSLTNPGSLPALYHCTGGKDRTGIATALLLSILGVDRETAINDFLFTNVFRTPFRVAALSPTLIANGIDPADMIGVLGVVRRAMEVALDTIESTYGGPERYLIDGGLDADAPQRLRDLLLQ